MTLNLCGEMGSDDDDNDEAGKWQRMNWYFQTYGGSSLPAMATWIFLFGKNAMTTAPILNCEIDCSSSVITW